MSANAEQIEYWNGRVGNRWAALQETIDASLAAIGGAALSFAAAKPGERVLDIGCGCGTTTLALAKAVAPMGVVEAIDISAPMLDLARERTKAAGVKIGFMQADAATHLFSARFDLVFSRFGVMFFGDPVSAFANIREALARRGRLAFVCWRGVGENLWASVPIAAARDLIPPQPAGDPHAPGPFAFADRDRLHGILEQAGFANIRIEALDTTMYMGTNVTEAAQQALNIGPLARAATELDEAQREKIRGVVATAMEKHKTAQGVTPAAACWLVGATL
ncbi:MAG TPA: methyltransferase domain-containing protein [Rhizomicrobium sp.]|jgi:SAM-dependent methyltransferase